MAATGIRSQSAKAQFTAFKLGESPVMKSSGDGRMPLLEATAISWGSVGIMEKWNLLFKVWS